MGKFLSTNPPCIFRLTIVKMEALFFCIGIIICEIYVGVVVERRRSICVIDTVFKLFLLHFGY